MNKRAERRRNSMRYIYHPRGAFVRPGNRKRPFDIIMPGHRAVVDKAILEMLHRRWIENALDRKLDPRIAAHQTNGPLIGAPVVPRLWSIMELVA